MVKAECLDEHLAIQQEIDEETERLEESGMESTVALVMAVSGIARRITGADIQVAT